MNSPNTLVGARDRAKEMLEGLLKHMDFQATVEAREQGDDEVFLQIASPDAGLLIARQAQALDAVQYLVNRMMRVAMPDVDAHYTVDAELYRERRKDLLLHDAFDAAEHVRHTGRPVSLAPLAAPERRIVHEALRNHEDLETFSHEPDGQGRKRLEIRLRPAGSRPPADAPPAELPPV